jgi:hypothetical protein
VGLERNVDVRESRSSSHLSHRVSLLLPRLYWFTDVLRYLLTVDRLSSRSQSSSLDRHLPCHSSDSVIGGCSSLSSRSPCARPNYQWKSLQGIFFISNELFSEGFFIVADYIIFELTDNMLLYNGELKRKTYLHQCSLKNEVATLFKPALVTDVIVHTIFHYRSSHVIDMLSRIKILDQWLLMVGGQVC